jgi:hypothetical protein
VLSIAGRRAGREERRRTLIRPGSRGGGRSEVAVSP